MARRNPTVTARRQDGHHGARVAICREMAPGDFGTAVPVEGFRKCGGFTVDELDDFCMWWTDTYAQAYPGETFAYLSPVNGRVTRSRMPQDFTPVPLPESSVEYERKQSAEFDQWDDAPPSDPVVRGVYAEYERIQRLLDEVLGRREAR